MRRLLKTNGFTLLEVLLYIASSAIVILALGTVFASILRLHTKELTIREVNANGFTALNFITQTIRGAELVNEPVAGVSGNTLSLEDSDASFSPVVFEIVGGVLFVTRGVNSPVALTNSKVIVSDLVIGNIGDSSTSGLVNISFQVTSLNSSGRLAYDYAKTFRTTVALRGP